MSDALFEIPLSAASQSLRVTLANQVYRVSVTWRDAVGLWLLDIADGNGSALVQGLPLVTGNDLLEQFRHLGIGGGLWVLSGDNLGDMPTFDGLGTTSKLYFAVAG